MVRSVAERSFLPMRGFVLQIGSMCILAGKTFSSALRPPYPDGNELGSQFLFALRVTWFPMIVASVCSTYGPAGIQAANFLNFFGARARGSGRTATTPIRRRARSRTC